MIKVIAFDFGGVIELSDFNLVEKACEHLGVSKLEWNQEYKKYNHLLNVESQSFEVVYCMVASKFSDKKETEDYISHLIKESRDRHWTNDDLIKFIRTLKGKYKIALLSNYPKILRQKLVDLNLIDLFDEVIISSEVGCQKPQPEIFFVLFNKFGVKPREVVFIDDTPRSLEGAREIGYVPILFKDNESMKEELAKILES
jgi:epoxide hydrolase-like predicted phosphatase